ncbi:Urocanase [Trinorchestia longiramus]|nr:Urocanase [Trinorchestia longiramus]
MVKEELSRLCGGLPLSPLPSLKSRNPKVPHAPRRTHALTPSQQQLALRNALRYFPETLHPKLAKEFAQELRDYGHIYMYRFVPECQMRAYPLEEYPCRTPQAAAVMLMIMNNLDHAVAQYPEELVTYGGNGQVFSNWAQFWLTMHYLSTMTEDQTLVLSSGHPVGLFPSRPGAPRLVISNGIVVPNYSSRQRYDDMFALGVTMYGQMTAGSFCYIGPQGIVHGTTLTVLNAGRKYLQTSTLAGRVFITSGLGGMSGAQAKAAVICGCVGVIAEVSEEALRKRYTQGWLEQYTDSLPELVRRIRQHRENKTSTSIGYLGNIVDVWEYLVAEYKKTGELLVDLGSDQTSCHNPFKGGYYPAQLTYQQANEMLAEDPEGFRKLVLESLQRQVAAINALANAGMYFWDYGNAFLLEASRAGADVYAEKDEGSRDRPFRYPSYVQDIMGDIFSLGFGPFRWVCCSGCSEDLRTTDQIALSVTRKIAAEGLPESVQQQYADNDRWLTEAGRHNLTVGSAARILYADQQGRVAIALAFNAAVHSGQLKSPVVISRDHHDVSGTDSPFRETANITDGSAFTAGECVIASNVTANITDGSAFTADMAVQNVIGDACRGATWVALHNGGGVGWGEVVNGGFGLVLDGSQAAGERARLMLNWDVANGVARRSWSGNSNASATIERSMQRDPLLKITLPHHADPNLLQEAFTLNEERK